MNRNPQIFAAGVMLIALTLPVKATLILSTDFTGRTVSGKTAENVTWTTEGIVDPGDLTWVVESGAVTGTPLFDSPDAQDHFAPDLNIHNEGTWSVTVPLTLTVPSLALENVVLDWQDFSNTGVFQGAGRDSQYTVTVTGAASGQLGTIASPGLPGTSGQETLTFTSPLVLFNTETYDLHILAGGTGPGNNTGLSGISLNGVIPEPSSIWLCLLGLVLLGRGKRINKQGS